MDRTAAEDLLRSAEAAQAAFRASDDPAAVARFEELHDRLLEALDWFLDGEPDQAFRLATALVPFWMATKRLDEGDRWFATALARAGPTDERRARALYDHGYLVFWAGRYDLAEERFDEARTLAREGGDADVEALALAGAARVALNRDPAEAVRLLRDALAVTADRPDSLGRSHANHVLGVALQMAGDLAGARDVMRERLSRAREQGHEMVVSIESANLSMVERQLGNLAAAAELSKTAIRIVAGRGEAMALAWTINGLAAVTAAQGDGDRAATLIGTAETLLARAGGAWPADERAQYEGTLAVLDRQAQPEAIARARAAGAAMTVEQAVTFALEDQADSG